jgi:hypothetical protein
LRSWNRRRKRRLKRPGQKKNRERSHQFELGIGTSSSPGARFWFASAGIALAMRLIDDPGRGNCPRSSEEFKVELPTGEGSDKLQEWDDNVQKAAVRQKKGSSVESVGERLGLCPGPRIFMAYLGCATCQRKMHPWQGGLPRADAPLAHHRAEYPLVGLRPRRARSGNEDEAENRTWLDVS